jgi:rhodanese-related sulfurtransferase
VRRVTPAEASKLVDQGQAILVDVREPDEWAETGVAAPAHLVSLSEIQGSVGKELAGKHGDKEIIFYCRSGGRSAAAAKAFAQQGLRTANAGGIRDWIDAGLPVRRI